MCSTSLVLETENVCLSSSSAWKQKLSETGVKGRRKEKNVQLLNWTNNELPAPSLPSPLKHIFWLNLMVPQHHRRHHHPEGALVI